MHVLHVTDLDDVERRRGRRCWRWRSGWCGRSGRPRRSRPCRAAARPPGARRREDDAVTLVFWLAYGMLGGGALLALVRLAKRAVAAGPGGRHRHPAGDHLGRARGLRGAARGTRPSCRSWSWCRCSRSSARCRWPATSAGCSCSPGRRHRRRPSARSRGARGAGPGGGAVIDPTSVSDVVAVVLLLAGCFLCLTAGLGLVRFPDVLSRMHAGTKPQVLGVLLIMIGGAIRLQGWSADLDAAAGRRVPAAHRAGQRAHDQPGGLPPPARAPRPAAGRRAAHRRGPATASTAVTSRPTAASQPS